jgi:GNAT superfamily N-acetyltransferase
LAWPLSSCDEAAHAANTASASMAQPAVVPPIPIRTVRLHCNLHATACKPRFSTSPRTTPDNRVTPLRCASYDWAEMHLERSLQSYRISTDPRLFDLQAIHAYLTRSYWAQGISRDVVARSIAASLSFGLFEDDAQIGFARVISDRTTFAYLADVYVLESYRGRGLGKWLIEVVMSHPDLQGLRRFVLATRDAHGLYEKFGFTALNKPGIFMEVFRPDIYETST